MGVRHQVASSEWMTVGQQQARSVEVIGEPARSIVHCFPHLSARCTPRKPPKSAQNRAKDRKGCNP